MHTVLESADSANPSISSEAQIDALLHAVGFAPLDSTGWIRVSGSDRVRWLNGMVTNGIQQLAPGEGCYNFVLNAQGRIQGDLTAFLLEDSILLETSREQMPALLAHFDRFIIMDDVELADLSHRYSGILIAGPGALRTVQQLGGAPCASPPPVTQPAAALSLKRTEYHGAPVHLIRAHGPLVPRFEVWADPAVIARIEGELLGAGALPVSPKALDRLHILEGTPRFGEDIRNTESAHDLPQETGQTRALHFTKGCYLGQEIVERIRSRGKVHRTFSGFELTGALPAPGATLVAEGKAVGELTSITAIPLASGTIQIALGYVRREALERGLPLEYSGGTATPIALPYDGSA